MTLLDEINGKFKELLEKYVGGISNTSTVKYDEIKLVVANELGLDIDSIYATGCRDRISNLDTRLAQGNIRNQHTPLGLAFISVSSKGLADLDVLEKTAKSFLSTVTKFVTGEERGTVYDGVIGFVQIDNRDTIFPLVFLYAETFSNPAAVLGRLPGAVDAPVKRLISPPPIASVARIARGASASAPLLLDASLIEQFLADISAAGLTISPDLAKRFVSSLLAKPFVILSGLSGSGKTRLAIALAKWFEEKDDQVQVVAVGADWTSSESILGYRDALDGSKYRRPANGALDVVLGAILDPDRPYFLILDEMNLSHVEQYFSDLLSSMESGELIALHASMDPVEDVPARIALPRNLFIIGTVNVDETTYMFSPKVLDRANVIEFRTTKEELLTFLDVSTSVDHSYLSGRGAPFAKFFVDAACDFPQLKDLPAEIGDGVEIHKELGAALGELHDLLSIIGAEFAYRTVREVSRFVYFHGLLTGKTWKFDDALDAQIVQKIMPKLHGSERRLRPVLEALSAFAEARNLKLSQVKVAKMQERLRDGFATFLD